MDLQMNCPRCGNYDIEYTTNGIICKNPKCPSNGLVKITVSNNTNN